MENTTTLTLAVELEVTPQGDGYRLGHLQLQLRTGGELPGTEDQPRAGDLALVTATLAVATILKQGVHGRHLGFCRQQLEAAVEHIKKNLHECG